MKKKLAKFSFTLIISGVDFEDERLEDYLFDASCGDATIIVQNGVLMLDFSRSAKNYIQAVCSAIEDVEGTKLGARVVKVEPDNFVSRSEIARRMAVSRQYVAKLFKDSHEVPLPVINISGESPLWSWQEIAGWLYRKRGLEKAKAWLIDARIREFINMELHRRLAARIARQSRSGESRLRQDRLAIHANR